MKSSSSSLLLQKQYIMQQLCIPPRKGGSTICIIYKETLVRQQSRPPTTTPHCKKDQVTREQLHLKQNLGFLWLKSGPINSVCTGNGENMQIWWSTSNVQQLNFVIYLIKLKSSGQITVPEIKNTIGENWTASSWNWPLGSIHKNKVKNLLQEAFTGLRLSTADLVFNILYAVWWWTKHGRPTVGSTPR